MNGRALTFFHTNMVGMNFTFADRETGTRWQQETGEAIDGALKGQHLEIYPFLITTWKEWRDRHRDTLVTVPVPGLEDLYSLMWQTILSRRPGRPGPPPDRTLRPEDPRLPAYEAVVGVETGGARRAYPLPVLARERVVNDQVGSDAVLVNYDPASDTVTVFARVFGERTLSFNLRPESGELIDLQTGSRWNRYGECVDGELRGSQLKAIIGMRQFWWSWAAFYPGTDVYPGKRD
jgi:hypothetical protein